jgi:hypothetical protein
MVSGPAWDWRSRRRESRRGPILTRPHNIGLAIVLALRILVHFIPKGRHALGKHTSRFARREIKKKQSAPPGPRIFLTLTAADRGRKSLIGILWGYNQSGTVAGVGTPTPVKSRGRASSSAIARFSLPRLSRDRSPLSGLLASSGGGLVRVARFEIAD